MHDTNNFYWRKKEETAARIENEIKDKFKAGMMLKFNNGFTPAYIVLNSEIGNPIQHAYDTIVTICGTRYSCPKGLSPEVMEHVSVRVDFNDIIILTDDEKEQVIESFTKLVKLYSFFKSSAIAIQDKLPYYRQYNK